MKKQIMRFFRRTVPYNSRLFKTLYFIYIRQSSKSRLKKKKPEEMDVQIHAACHCNLNCKGCNAFSPVIEKSIADTDVTIKDLARLSELTGGVLSSLTVSGGEPLLNPELPEIIKSAREYFPGQKLQIITNGSLLERAPESFWESCRNNDAAISLTFYPVKINIEKIKEIADSHSVHLIYQDDTDVREKTMYYTPLDSDGKQSLKESYMLCFMANYCMVLENGKMFTCPVIAHIGHFNKFFNRNFNDSNQDYIDIYKAQSIDEIADFMCKPMPFCRYCDKKARVSGLAWQTSKREISEWT
jgi:MoaA/NifB/PqqE/SkfB family radical SAM enzyme